MVMYFFGMGYGINLGGNIILWGFYKLVYLDVLVVGGRIS